MNKTHRVAKRIGRIGVLVLAVLLALGWAWYTMARTVDDLPKYEIINDEYDHITAIEPGVGLDQQLLLEPQTTLYGVRLKLATYNKVVQGQLTAQVLDDQGTVLASASADMTTILDNTFMGLVLDRPVRVEQPQTCRLHLEIQPADPQDQLGLWAGPLQPGLALTGAQGTQPAQESAALQYMVDYTGGVVSRFYWAPALLLAGAVLLGALLAARRAKPEALFCTAGLLIGLAFSLITPPLAGPDEYAHVAASYSLSNRLLGQQEWDDEGRLYMRPCDAPYMTAQTGEIGPFAYKTVAEHLLETGCENEASVPVAVKVPYTRVHLLYLVQSLGVSLARLLGLGFFGMLWLGRLANLALYLGLGWLALRHMPFGKEVLFCVLMLPMGLQQAASFSTDGPVLSICFAFTALALEASAQKEPLRRGQIIGLLVLSAALGPCKAVYVLLLALCWLIPKERFPRPALAWAFRLGSVGAALAGWLLYNYSVIAYLFRDVTLLGVPVLLAAAAAGGLGLRYAIRRWGKTRAFRVGMCLLLVLVLAVMAVMTAKGWLHLGGTLTPEELAAGIQPNGESIYTYSVGYTLRHLPTAVRVLVTTLTQDGPLLLQELLGTRLSEPIVYQVEVSWLITLGLVLVLIAASLRDQNAPLDLPGAKKWAAGGVAAAVTLLVIAASFTWTPINMQHLFGLQGRYLLPVLPLVLLCLGENCIFCRKSNGTGVRLAMVGLTALTALQGLCLYGAWPSI